MKATIKTLNSTNCWLLMPIIVLLLILWPTKALSLEFIPSIDTIDVTSNLDTKYIEAIRNAQRAFLIQSGVKAHLDVLRRTLNDKISDVESELTTKVDSFLNIPHKKQIYALTGSAFMLFIKKTYRGSFRNPFFSQLNHHVNLNSSSAEVGLSIHF